MDKWYNSATDLRSFLSILIDAEAVEDTDDVQAFLSHPQKWNEEYKIWEAAGFPQQDDGAWDEFVNDITLDENNG